MPLEEYVPKVFEALLKKTLGNHMKIGAEFDRFQLRTFQCIGPVPEPLRCSRWGFQGMPKRGEQMRFTLTATAQQHNGTSFVRLCRLEHAQEVNGWIGDTQKVCSGSLEGAGRLVARKVDCCPFEAFPFELIAQC